MIGSSAIAYPAQPATSLWHSEPVPTEPPLGYRIDEMEPVGEVHERGAPSTTTAPDDVKDEGGGLNRPAKAFNSIEEAELMWILAHHLSGRAF